MYSQLYLSSGRTNWFTVIGFIIYHVKARLNIVSHVNNVLGYVCLLVQGHLAARHGASSNSDQHIVPNVCMMDLSHTNNTMCVVNSWNTKRASMRDVYRPLICLRYPGHKRHAMALSHFDEPIDTLVKRHLSECSLLSACGLGNPNHPLYDILIGVKCLCLTRKLFSLAGRQNH